MDSQSDAGRMRELVQSGWAAEVARLMARVVELQAEVGNLKGQNEQLRAECASQQEEIDALRAQLGQSEAQSERPAEETAPRKGPVQRRERLFAFPEGQMIIAQDRTMMQDDTVTVVEIPDSVTKIDKNAFRNWRALERVSLSSDSSLEFVGIGAFQDSGIRKFKAPGHLKTISQCAFAGCRDLRRVVLNEGLQSLGMNERLKNGLPF